MSKQTTGANQGGSAAARQEPKQPVVQPSVQHIAAHFTAAELHCLRGVCRDADNENASRYLAAALQRAAVAGGAK